jgi:hypothetical protein
VDVTATLAFPLSGRLKLSRRTVPTCTRLPWSADIGADPEKRDARRQDVSLAVFPLTGPRRASGLASNVFRRSAAHSFGLHATPAVEFHSELSRLPAVPHLPEGRHLSHDTRGVRIGRVCRVHRPTVKQNRCPDTRLTRSTRDFKSTCGLGALKA